MSSPPEVLLAWNRRLHYFIGLYLLFFCWLFVFTGLLLNHPRWQFAQFWPTRVQSASDQHVSVPASGSDVARARDVMQQLGLAGEIQWPAAQVAGAPFAFQVTRPGLIVDVKVDIGAEVARVERNQLNAWGTMNLLHSFTGIPAASTNNTRDWALTTVWGLSMDAVAAGLIVMVFSSYIMWYRLKAKRRGGIAALLLGVVGCGALIYGLAWPF